MEMILSHSQSNIKVILMCNCLRAIITPLIPKGTKLEQDLFVEKVLTEHSSLRGIKPDDCKIAFLKKAANYALYGATVFSVMVRNFFHSMNDFPLCTCTSEWCCIDQLRVDLARLIPARFFNETDSCPGNTPSLYI